MNKRELTKIVGQVVLAAIPTLALTTACRTTGEATYVVRSNGRTCHDACATLSGGNSAEGPWRVSDVMECVEAAEVQTPTSGSETTEGQSPVPLATPVAVCRMRTRYMGGIGRRPAGLTVADALGEGPLGAYFARTEQLERAAVLAFARTERELRLHGAPAHLVRDVIRARREEEQHVAIAARWRARFGGRLGTIAAPDASPRSLAALARENAAEGCVHETWGAILARAQAAKAAQSPPELARDLARIAGDEASHAALSQRLDRWARSQLSATALRSLARAQRDAVAEVRRSLAEEHEPALAAVGWPSTRERRALFETAFTRFGWSEAA